MRHKEACLDHASLYSSSTGWISIGKGVLHRKMMIKCGEGRKSAYYHRRCKKSSTLYQTGGLHKHIACCEYTICISIAHVRKYNHIVDRPEKNDGNWDTKSLQFTSCIHHAKSFPNTISPTLQVHAYPIKFIG